MRFTRKMFAITIRNSVWTRDSDAVVIITATLRPSPFQQSLLIFYVRAFSRKFDCSYSAVHTSANVLQVSDFVVSTSDDLVDWYFRHVVLLPESVMHIKERERNQRLLRDIWRMLMIYLLKRKIGSKMYVRWLFINCKLLCLFFHLEQNGKYFHFAHTNRSHFDAYNSTHSHSHLTLLLVFVSRAVERI